MKVMILMVTVLFPNLQAETNAMFALNGVLDIKHCQTIDIPRVMKQYTKEIPFALDIHARCVIVDRDKPIGVPSKEADKEEKELTL